MNNFLLKRFKNTLNNVEQIHMVGSSPVRPSADLFAAIKQVALISVVAVGASNAALAAPTQDIKSKAFDSAYKTTLQSEGGYRITVDMPVKKGKQVVRYDRVFEALTSDTVVENRAGSLVLTDTKNHKTLALPESDVNAKVPVITHAGIDNRYHNVDILRLQPDQIKQIYRENYWPEKLLNAGGNIAKIAFDIGVNQGVTVRNEMLAKVTRDLSNYEINPKLGLSSADIAVITGIAKSNPGAFEYGLSRYANDRYQELMTQSRFEKNNGWLVRAENYAKLAGESGRDGYEKLLANANQGREAMLAQADVVDHSSEVSSDFDQSPR